MLTKVVMLLGKVKIIVEMVLLLLMKMQAIYEHGEDSASRTDLNHENQSSDVNYGEQTILSGGTGGSSGGSGTDREDEDKLLDNQVGNLMQDLFKRLPGSLCCNQWQLLNYLDTKLPIFLLCCYELCWL